MKNKPNCLQTAEWLNKVSAPLEKSTAESRNNLLAPLVKVLSEAVSDLLKPYQTHYYFLGKQ